MVQRFPTASAVTLTNASVPSAVMGRTGDGALQTLDIVVADGRIAAIRPAGSAPAEGVAYDLDGGLILPCFVDIHTHLDKGHIWPRKANPDGT